MTYTTQPFTGLYIFIEQCKRLSVWIFDITFYYSLCTGTADPIVATIWQSNVLTFGCFKNAFSGFHSKKLAAVFNFTL